MIRTHAYDAGPIKGTHCLYNCGQPETKHERSEYAPGENRSRAALRATTGSNSGLRGKPTSPEAAKLEQEGPMLGLATTRELLGELLVRGDVAMIAFPGSLQGADGSVLSALANVILKSCCEHTLNYRTASR